jgi:hypothetical protein
MKKYHVIILCLSLSSLLVSCAAVPHDRYNTQKGAAIGAGIGALIGQAIGGNTEGTLMGLAAGTILGALVGNAVDQDSQAVREAAQYGKPVIFYDHSGHAVEAIPEEIDDPKCIKVRKRIWENGEMIKETVEEICGPSPPVARYYPPPPPPPAYYYWLGWPVFPRFSFYYGRPYYHGYFRYRHYPRHHGWHHR